MTIDFSKYADGLVPAVVQDVVTNKVLMLGFMNQEAVDVTNATGKVTFYSRSKQRLWTKGETSEHYLLLKSITVDCDNDTLLVKAQPIGPTCHTGADTCFNEVNQNNPADFLWYLESVIAGRKNNPTEKSYTASLFAKGINKVAQKVGEEAVELVIEAKDDNEELFLGEAADPMFHYIVLLQAKGYSLTDVVNVLRGRHK
ncbi:bifunctional phosphoribosyl-AMP cyclohydrolase/phosphoribosyl-ATP diphosphatase HisIE [Phnomibacter ginsenosidimutans]|uniref:Histidine biosynthesis bifunctional protein HisIE n=1 Tax=Phnomibacter ginsenosidimutans TaxID=2676868 RepID=A0A6I6GPV6_9BACT|nr:bifunctional phosphoribosyl-AMP cyclohydrolase/phosphoribosyl-ATP diphosphatase HisIE [Phnomibacter ginsenosidimutans]QGW28982.1 bifunctional phosphoribosyl-AMP cyclohydrolase/phosphoribosyl-ATP diphosphatase HisIE [Phnomibacter ginsenosidimutans]